ncbi:hypothetical protein CJF30_00007188 [Rutstroemia sp. NJR-2017a BBW]|nr:hypothetical protein CJF30_00007188 [Rutstroemia sp. NJR-2017a BBW]
MVSIIITPVRARKSSERWLHYNEVESHAWRQVHHGLFAVFGPIATGINGGSFQWIPPTTIPDGTYIVNLVETPNKVNVNGLSFNGDPFAFGDPSANQPQSQTSTTVAPQTLVVTTTSEAEKTTVLAPTTILLVSTQSAEFTVQSTTFSDLEAPGEVTTSSGETAAVSASAETSVEGSSSVVVVKFLLLTHNLTLNLFLQQPKSNYNLPLHIPHPIPP